MSDLDWTHHTVGPLRPCRLCGRGAFLRDDQRRPCHKTCAERVADAAPLDVDQGDALADLVYLPKAHTVAAGRPGDTGADALPLAPVFDLTTRRRVA